MILQDLVDELGGNMVQGDPEWMVDGVNSHEKAGAFDMAFADSDASVTAAFKSNAGVVVLKPGAATEYPHGKCIVESDQPKLWFAKAAHLVKKSTHVAGIAHSAIVAQDAKVDQGVLVGPCAVIGMHARIGDRTIIGAGAVIGENVTIGMHCHIYPRAVIYPGTTLGDRVVVHAGAVLGADGFGYVRDTVTGEYTQFPQQGTLTIEDDVEIGANSTVDRGALEETRIRRGTKIDNLVHVGHNCDIGERCHPGRSDRNFRFEHHRQRSGAGRAGRHRRSCARWPGVILGGQAGVFNGKTISNEGQGPGTVMFGTPARPLKQVLREQAMLTKLTKAARPGRKQGAHEANEGTA